MENSKDHRLIIAIGSNQGDWSVVLEQSLLLIGQSIGRVESISPIYNTPAWGNTDQPDFKNGVLSVITSLEPHTCLEQLLKIEVQMGRVRKEKWGPRILDLDILFYDSKVIQSPTLVVPHPFIEERQFVLQPLADILPNYVHPVNGKTIEDLLHQLPEKVKMERLANA